MLRTITKNIVIGSFLLLEHINNQTLRQAIQSAVQWIDLLSAFVLLSAVLMWLLRKRKLIKLDHWENLLLICSAMQLFFLFCLAITKHLWFNGTYIDTIFQLVRRTSLETSLWCWLAILVLLTRARIKNIGLYWQVGTPIAIIIVLGNAYAFFNSHIIVRILGCGCNFHSFNANDFSALFFALMLIADLCLLVYASSKLKLNFRFLYLILGIPLLTLLAWGRLMLSIWL